MGVYYNIGIKVPIEGLTDTERDSIDWQIKDFDGWGDLLISEDGRLFDYDYEVVPEDERPYCKGKPPGERDAWDKFFGAIRKKKLIPKNDKNYHGDLIFYGSNKKVKNNDWFEFIARFIDGKLERIKRLK